MATFSARLPTASTLSRLTAVAREDPSFRGGLPLRSSAGPRGTVCSSRRVVALGRRSAHGRRARDGSGDGHRSDRSAAPLPLLDCKRLAATSERIGSFGSPDAPPASPPAPDPRPSRPRSSGGDKDDPVSASCASDLDRARLDRPGCRATLGPASLVRRLGDGRPRTTTPGCSRGS
jgi:hypothetical protein